MRKSEKKFSADLSANGSSRQVSMCRSVCRFTWLRKKVEIPRGEFPCDSRARYSVVLRFVSQQVDETLAVRDTHYRLVLTRCAARGDATGRAAKQQESARENGAFVSEPPSLDIPPSSERHRTTEVLSFSTRFGQDLYSGKERPRSTNRAGKLSISSNRRIFRAILVNNRMSQNVHGDVRA